MLRGEFYGNVGLFNMVEVHNVVVYTFSHYGLVLRESSERFHQAPTMTFPAWHLRDSAARVEKMMSQWQAEIIEAQ